MSFNSDKIYDALNQSSITDLLDTVSDIKGLFDSRAIPDFFTSDKTINFYLLNFDGSTEFQQYTYSVNCRAKTDGESLAIAQAVFNALNRADFTDYHTNCIIQTTLPPIDDNDVFNTPVEVLLKIRNN